MNPLGPMMDQAIYRRAYGLRCAIFGLAIVRALGAMLPFFAFAAKHGRIVDPVTGLA